MDFQIAQYLTHGSGENFNRWLDETQFQVRQCIGEFKVALQSQPSDEAQLLNELKATQGVI